MGLFSSDDEKEIVVQARGNSITDERLFEKSGRILKRLKNKPIVEYLREEEQPHYLFQGPKTGLETKSTADVDGISPDGSHHAFLVVTDQRVAVLIGKLEGDDTVSLAFEEIRSVNININATKFKIRLGVKPGMCIFHSGKKMGKDEAQEAVEYIRSQIPEDSSEIKPPDELEISQDSDGECVSDVSADNPSVSDDAGSTVTQDRVDTISDFLQNSEKVVHLLRVPMVHHGPDAENKSMSTKFTETGTAAFTNERVVIKIPHQMADDQFTIRYQNIQNVAYNLEGISGQRNFEITTPGEKHRIGVHYRIDDDEVREIVNWLDEKAAKASTDTVTTNEEKSVKGRLSELQELKEEGFITNGEFEEKKSEIMEEL